MTYDDYEQSAQSGAPIEGFKFAGTFTTYRYTSAQQDQTIFSELYTAVAISRNAIKATTQNDDGGDLEVVIPYDLQLALDYAYSKAPPRLTLEIVRYHRVLKMGVDDHPFRISDHHIPYLSRDLMAKGVVPEGFFRLSRVG